MIWNDSMCEKFEDFFKKSIFDYFFTFSHAPHELITDKLLHIYDTNTNNFGLTLARRPTLYDFEENLPERSSRHLYDLQISKKIDNTIKIQEHGIF